MDTNGGNQVTLESRWALEPDCLGWNSSTTWLRWDSSPRASVSASVKWEQPQRPEWMLASIRHRRPSAQPQVQRSFPVSTCWCLDCPNVGFAFYPDQAHGGRMWRLWIPLRVPCDVQTSLEAKGRGWKAVWGHNQMHQEGLCNSRCLFSGLRCLPAARSIGDSPGAPRTLPHPLPGVLTYLAAPAPQQILLVNHKHKSCYLPSLAALAPWFKLPSRPLSSALGPSCRISSRLSTSRLWVALCAIDSWAGEDGRQRAPASRARCSSWEPGPVFLVKLLSGHVRFLIRFLPGRGSISCSSAGTRWRSLVILKPRDGEALL